MLECIVHAGSFERVSPVVSITLPPEAVAAVHRLRGTGSVAGAVPVTLWLHDIDTPRSAIAAQVDLDDATLAFVVPGTLPAGSRRHFRLAIDQPDRSPAQRAPAFPMQFSEKLDRVIFHAGGTPWAVYHFHGGRRPYFWPLLGPYGASVVRGQGTAEHPHHTGMGLTYGGHSEGGSTNIWSDWDEPPFGPGGRMLHRGFRRLAGGPVYGELVQSLTYVNAFGEPIAEEVRTIRCWFASPAARYLDFRFDIVDCRDRGPRPFLFMIRLPGSFDIPKTGCVTNAVGHPVPSPCGVGHVYHAAWVDGSGPAGGPPALPPAGPPEDLVDLPGAMRKIVSSGAGPWNGIALFDHSANHGYPNAVGKYAVVPQLTQVHYPPPTAPDGPFTFRHRVYVHADNAEVADVAARAADYAEPCAVDVWVLDDSTGA